ncbi:MAG: hypothetical protein Q4A41_04485 [Bacillota bacterium]|nr:hypothetical protein [Bacillota bacterium]
MNALVFSLSAVSIVMIGEELPWRELSLVHAAYLILQMELAGICFGISAFIRKGGVASGIGVATVMYTLNIIANVAKSVENLKYVTPYGYCDGGYIVHHGSLDSGKVLIGISAGVIGIIIAYWKYSTKDIH